MSSLRQELALLHRYETRLHLMYQRACHNILLLGTVAKPGAGRARQRRSRGPKGRPPDPVPKPSRRLPRSLLQPPSLGERLHVSTDRLCPAWTVLSVLPAGAIVLCGLSASVQPARAGHRPPRSTATPGIPKRTQSHFRTLPMTLPRGCDASCDGMRFLSCRYKLICFFQLQGVVTHRGGFCRAMRHRIGLRLSKHVHVPP